MSKFNESIRAVHALAVLRHLDTEPQQIGIVFTPLRPDCYPAGEKAPPSVPECSPGREHGEACHWEAQVRLGGGKWGASVGVGYTPENALESLRQGYVTAHRVVDDRRASLMARLGGVAPSNAANEKLLADLLNVLSQHCGERGNSEGALETLNRLVSESKVDGRAYKHGRSEGRADVVAELRAILDPDDAHHWNQDGVLGEVRRLAQSTGSTR